jgi:hypothetical protein
MTNRARVFIPQVPSRFDHDNNMWMPSVDITTASKYGKVITMLPPEANRLDTVPLYESLRKRMKDFTEKDYIVALGDPTIFAIVACLAAKQCNGHLRMLKWDRQSAGYITVEVVIR